MNGKKVSSLYIAFCLIFIAAQSVCAKSSVTLEVQPVTQKSIVWCWLAVAEMAIRYYNWDESPSQCRIMEHGYGLSPGTCCQNPKGCARTGSLTEIVNIIKHYGGVDAFITGPPKQPKDVYKALAKNKLVIAALHTSMGSGHVVVIRGVRKQNGSIQLLVNDPMSVIARTLSYQKLHSMWRETVIINYKGDLD